MEGREGLNESHQKQKKRNHLAEVNTFELWTTEERNLTISTVWIMSFWAQKSFWISYIGSYNFSINYQDHSCRWTRLKMFLRSFLHYTHRRILFRCMNLCNKTELCRWNMRPSLENVKSTSWTALVNDSFRISMWNDRSKIAGDVQHDLQVIISEQVWLPWNHAWIIQKIMLYMKKKK
jgi:hypothetical protein